MNWIESKDKVYFMKTMRKLHKDRLINISADGKEIEILPPGTLQVEKLISKLGQKN